jgi:hypothetical protein
MLPDLPDLKARLHQIQEDFILSEARRNLKIFSAPPSLLWEGRSIVVMRDTELDEQELFSAEASTMMKPASDEMPDILKKLQKMGKDMSEKVEPELFKRLDAILEKNGQVATAGSSDFQDVILDTFSKLELPLDRHGKIDRSRLTVVIHPEQSEKFEKLVAKAEADPEFMARFDNLMAEKQKEADERENNRKLVR